MRSFIKCSRIVILFLLCVSVIVPVFILSNRLKQNSDASVDFVKDLSIVKHKLDDQTLSAEQDENEGLKEPFAKVYKVDADDSGAVNISSSEDHNFDELTDGADSDKHNETRDSTVRSDKQEQQEEDNLHMAEEKEESPVKGVQHDQEPPISKETLDQKVREMKDQVIRAKAYINFSPSNSSSHLVKELRLRMKDVERALSQSTKDSRLSRSSMQKMRAMESTLLKASRIYPDCHAMVKKLRAMTFTAEEQVRHQRGQETFLKGVGARTIPKGLHCLSMRLTADYYGLGRKERVLPNKHKLHYLDHYHFAVFSDNILACSVVVNSTISMASEPEKIVFHVVTNSINYPAMSMWFLLNPPGKATIDVQSIDSFKPLSPSFITPPKKVSVDLRFTSELNHLRFYLADVFPHLKKIVLLDHDVVIQKDLTKLWEVNMRGKVNGAVHTCTPEENSYRRMDMFINFTDPVIAKRFDANACTWAFGVNIFDLKEWRHRNVNAAYQKYLRLGNTKPLLKSGSLPIGWMTFYSHTTKLDKKWQALGLGYDPSIKKEVIENAAVLHYDGMLKPWLDIGIEKYKRFWMKHVNYEHPYLQQCNIRE